MGDINVGKTEIIDPTEENTEDIETGIFTSSGGAISILARGDINVNESRVMTFCGGDITVWSDENDINAGRGSTTAINVGSPTIVNVYDDDGNIVSRRIEWEPPAVGSGIRTLTYDPDGYLGEDEAPEAGGRLSVRTRRDH